MNLRDWNTPIYPHRMTTPTLAQRLAKLGIGTWAELGTLVPRTYQDRSSLPPIIRLPDDGPAVITGRIMVVNDDMSKHRVHLLKVTVADHTGPIHVVFFNQAYLKPILKIGLEVVITGKLERNPYTHIKQLLATELDVIRSVKDREQLLGCIVPIYPLTAGLYQSKIRSLIQYALDTMVPHVPDFLPPSIRERLNIMPLSMAIHTIHRPNTMEAPVHARMRLVFDEFLRYQLSLLKRRHEFKRLPTPCLLTPQSDLHDRYIQQLPYTLTNAQWQSIYDIQRDVTSGIAMNRLIQGDVGSGKTDVIVMAILMAISAGYSAVLMAPTDVLASQHYHKLSHALSAIGVDTVLLKGSLKTKAKRDTLTRLKSPQPVVAIGTHSLIQDPVDIHQVGLVVIDEQHRFGVQQRIRLAQKGNTPHCLYTTATPIPRTFMLTIYGELEKSIISEMPPGRIPATTIRMRMSQLDEVISIMSERLQQGQQVYVVYPLIEASSKLDLASAIEGHADIQSRLPQHQVGLLHGKLPVADKDRIMSQFKQGEMGVLVSTTVIEVGVDVPNATMMVIMNAERFGLSQLHQLRGRIGRGVLQSTCILVSDRLSDISKKRLDAMVDTNNGFELAELDLKLRGPGEVLGVRQSGLPQFRVADLVKDEPLLVLARKVGIKMIETDPTLQHPSFVALREWVDSADYVSESGHLN